MPGSMRYTRRVLQPNERLVYATRLHWYVYLQCVVFVVACIALAIAANAFARQPRNISLALWIAAGIFLLLACVAGVHAFIRRATTELAITDHRVIYKTGLLRRHTLEMNRGRVDSVYVDQSILGRLLDYGTIIVRGAGGSIEPIRDIAEPLTFRRQITMSP
jgi:uncharacterized membrane protein YdbT with pleckstrin-like domain